MKKTTRLKYAQIPFTTVDDLTSQLDGVRQTFKLKKKVEEDSPYCVIYNEQVYVNSATKRWYKLHDDRQTVTTYFPTAPSGGTLLFLHGISGESDTVVYWDDVLQKRNFSLDEAGLILGSDVKGQIMPTEDGKGVVVGFEEVEKTANDALEASQKASEGLEELKTDVESNTARISTLESDLEAEETARSEADNALGVRIGINEGDIADLKSTKADKAEIPKNVSELNNDSGYITKSVNDLENYYTNNETDAAISTAVSGEADARSTADNNLQEQIDAISASSDVKDIVGTRAELEAYDTSKLGDNDIVKVILDSAHDDAMTYNRWHSSTSTWEYIGAEGPFYTRSEADGVFTPQTRTVNGKALSSDISLTASDVGALPSTTVIPTVNNATLTIQKNGSTVKTFTANAASNVTANITVPTKTSDITNDSGFVTSSVVDGYAKEADLATVAKTGSYNDLSDKPSIPAEQVNSDWNATSGKAEILNKPTIPSKTSDLTNDSNFVTNSTYASSSNAGVVKVGTGLAINDGVLSATSKDAVWGNITGTMSNQKDLNDALNDKLSLSKTTTQTMSGALYIGSPTSNIGNAYTHQRKVTSPITGANVNGVAFAVAATGEASFQHKTYSDTGGAAKNDSVLRFWKDHIQFASNNGSGNTPSEDSYKELATQEYVGSQGFVKSSELATVATSGSYSDLSNKPTIPAAAANATITIKQGGVTKGSFTTNQSSDATINIDASEGGGAVDSVNGKTGVVVLNASDVSALPASTHIPTTVAELTDAEDYATVDQISGKQDALTTAQLNAVNSGITHDKLNTYDNYASQISAKANSADLAKVATSGSYTDLSNKPTIPAAANNATITIQKNGSNQGSFTLNQADAKTINIQLAKADVGLANVNNTSDANKPISTATQTALDAKANSADLATVATSGSYNDLSNKPTIPSAAHNATITITQDGVTKGSFTTDQATNATIALDGGGEITNAVWGQITGTLSNQTDLKTELDSKVTAIAPGTPTEVAPDVTTNRIVDGAITLPKLNKSDILNLFYPVGCYFETSDTTFNPNSSWGGTWVEDSAGRVLVAQNSDTFATVGATGGEETHTLTISEIPSHRHTTSKAGSQGKAQAQTSGSSGYAWNADGGYSGFEGGGGAHNNLQPYIVIKRWHRTA